MPFHRRLCPHRSAFPSPSSEDSKRPLFLPRCKRHKPAFHPAAPQSPADYSAHLKFLSLSSCSNPSPQPSASSAASTKDIFHRESPRFRTPHPADQPNSSACCSTNRSPQASVYFDPP